jgi:hypothetical protein
MKPFIGNSYFLTRKNKRDKHLKMTPLLSVTTKYYLLTCSLLLALLLVLPLLHQRIRASVRLQPAKYLVLLPPLSLALRPAVRDRTTCAELQLAAVGTLSDFADVAADGLATQIVLEYAATM